MSIIAMSTGGLIFLGLLGIAGVLLIGWLLLVKLVNDKDFWR